MLTRLIAVVAAASLFGACGSDEPEQGAIAGAVAEQLQYLRADSASVAVADLRWDGDNWDELRPIADRLFAAIRDAEPDAEFPGSLQGAAEEVAQEAGLKFSEDIEPALDGHLVIGETLGGGEQILVYRTQEGDLRKLAEAVAEVEPRPLEGHEDTVVFDESLAIVGTKTAVLTDSDVALRAAFDRAERDAGFPVARLEEAGRDVDMDDPLLLATGDLGSVRGLLAVDDADFERARDAVPYLRALRRGSLGIDVSDDGFEAKARLVTDGEELGEDDLPVGPAGELELPSEGEATVVGANRDQSYTTVFGAKVARALFADSRFVGAVERAEKELGISFEDEVLRQFDCPSVSVLDPAGDRTNARFAARSCLNDPDRMRQLLPRLRPYLPAILNGLDGLGTGGLTALLLLAPDAPLVPGAVLGQIDVDPLGGEDDEQLYEVKSPPRGGPDRMVFGLIGDAFVVATDEEMARRAAELDTESLDEDAAGAVRLPVADLLGFTDADTKAFVEVFDDLVATISADPDATVASARLDLRD